MLTVLTFGDREYLIFLTVLVGCRLMDLISTWVATPNLVLEGNPVARRLGWRLGLVVNAGMCLMLAFWPMATIIVATTSLLVAARNFRTAWLMRSMGEERYLIFMLNQLRVTPPSLFLFCLVGETGLMAVIGAGLMAFSSAATVAFSVGAGFIAYAVAVLFYSCLSLWKAR